MEYLDAIKNGLKRMQERRNLPIYITQLDEQLARHEVELKMKWSICKCEDPETIKRAFEYLRLHFQTELIKQKKDIYSQPVLEQASRAKELILLNTYEHFGKLMEKNDEACRTMSNFHGRMCALTWNRPHDPEHLARLKDWETGPYGPSG